MTDLSLQSIVSFNLHLGHQPSQPLARHVASAFDTLQSDLGEVLKAEGSSPDASTYRSWPQVQHPGLWLIGFFGARYRSFGDSAERV